MKLPSLRKPKPRVKSKAAAKPEVRMPRFVEDVYRDMRDRRLLLPAALLIVAIVAVPLALSAPKETPPEALAYTPPEGSEAVAPAVLTETPIGVRDYRERLDELKSKNPFADKFAFPEGAAGDGGATDTAPVVSDPGVPPPGGTDIGGAGIPNNDTGAPTGVGTPPDATDTAGGDDGDDRVLILAPRIDVSAGRLGNRKEIDDVEIGDLLPDRRKAPVVMFLGASEDLKFAEFLVSRDVTETKGDGSCRPSRNNCEFLRMRDGEKQSFLYEPDGRRYMIKVTDIREEIVDRR